MLPVSIQLWSAPHLVEEKVHNKLITSLLNQAIFVNEFSSYQLSGFEFSLCPAPNHQALIHVGPCHRIGGMEAPGVYKVHGFAV